jgi:transcription antitermination protein NusB
MTAVTGIRRSGRAYALQVLYARDGELADVAVAENAAARWAGELELEVDEQAQQFARELVAAAAQRAAEIDELISAASKNWRIDRMSRVDRNILRLGACELLTFKDVPLKVVINEAVELAKRFGTAESSAFVNGVLDRIASAIGRSPES